MMDRYANLYRWAAIAVIGILVMFPLQMSVFALAWPPPATAADSYSLLQDNWLIGLLSLDVLLLVDWVLMVPVWLALYVALRRTSPSAVLLSVTLALVAVSTYFASNTAFEMLSLSAQHAAADTEAERQMLLAAGEAHLAGFAGTAFDVSYVLSGLATLIASIVMLRDPAFGRAIGVTGIVYATLNLVPATAGTLGLILSVVSLLPMLAWLVMLCRKLFRLARGDGSAAGSAALS